MRFIVDDHRSVHDADRPAEITVPDACADNGDALGAGHRFLLAEKAADGWLHPEEREEAGGRIPDTHGTSICPTAAGGALIDCVGCDRGLPKTADRLTTSYVDVAHGGRCEGAHARRICGDIQPNDAIGVCNMGGSAKEQAVRYPEQGRVRTSGEGQCRDDEPRKQRFAPEAAQRQGDVAPHSFEAAGPGVPNVHSLGPLICAKSGKCLNRVHDRPDARARTSSTLIELTGGRNDLVAKPLPQIQLVKAGATGDTAAQSYRASAACPRR